MRIDSATLSQIRRIELRTRRIVNDSFAGAYRSVFKGRGMVFDSVRAYEPGDDVRSIDWNVTARTGEPFVKRFVEERELTVMLALDTSASVLFGTTGRLKRDLAAEVGAVLTLAATTNNDKVGLLVFSDRLERFIPPRKGRNHVLRLIRELLITEPTHTGTDLGLALRTLNRVLRRRTIIFFLSDFLAPAEDYEAELLVTGRRHDVIALALNDPLERSWPVGALVGLRDAETGAALWLDTARPNWRDGYARQTARFVQTRDAALARAQVDRIDIPLDGDYASALITFFQQRARRLQI